MTRNIYTRGEINAFIKAKEKGHNREIYENYNRAKIWNMPTPSQWDRVPNIYAQDGKGDKAKVYMKLFTPDKTFYITEFDKNTGDMFGYVRNEADPYSSEWGYTNYNQLKKAVAQSKGIYFLDRDRQFSPTTVGELKQKGKIK